MLGRSRVALACERDGVRRVAAVVGVEQRDVEVVADAVRGEQPLDHADQRVLPRRGDAVAGAASRSPRSATY